MPVCACGNGTYILNCVLCKLRCAFSVGRHISFDMLCSCVCLVIAHGYQRPGGRSYNTVCCVMLLCLCLQ